MDLLDLIKVNPEYTIAALIKVYKNQTANEQYIKNASELNNIGFNAFDAPAMSSIAEKYLDTKTITKNQLNYVQKVITKYRKQFDISIKPLSITIVESGKSIDKKETIKGKGKLATLNNDRIEITFLYNKNTVEDVKALEGRKWNPEIKAWTAPLTKVNVDRLLSYGFNICPKLQAFVNEYNNVQITAKDIPMNITPFPFQVDGINFVEKNKGRVLIADEMGCITKDTELIINVRGTARRWKMNKIYNRFVSRDEIMYTRSLSKDKNEFRLNKIEGVYYKGKKKVYLLKTKTHSIKATKDHIFITNKGDKELKDLKIGDILFTNGANACPICKSTENIIYYKHSKFKGYCKKCMYRLLRSKGKEYKEELGGNGNYIQVMGMQNHPYNRTDGVSKHRLVYEAYLNGMSYEDWKYTIRYNKIISSHRFLTPKEIIHHIDEDKSNNELDNLEYFSTSSDHQKRHSNYKNFGKFFIPKQEKIISIEYYGIEDVYDITMQSPNNNFIANGIVVHNCGKTIQAIGYYALHSERRPVLVVVPASLKGNWEKEINKCLPDEPVQIISGRSLMDYYIINGFIIINYDIISHHLSALEKIPFKGIIIDECHYIKNQKAERTKATKFLAKKIEDVLALSGTPITNKPLEFFTILNILQPIVFKSWWNYVTRYCGAKRGYWGLELGGATNTEELYNKLINTVMLRRLKKDVLKDLPDKTRTIIPMRIKNSKEYKEILADFINWSGSYTGNQKLGMVKIQKLQQVAAIGKMESVFEWVDNMLETGEKLVIFATHHKTIDMLMKRYKDKTVKIDGRTSTAPNVRSDIVNEFQTNENIRLFVGSIKAAGVGLTLTVSSNVAFIEYPWVPSDVLQAEDRCHRIGQKNAVNVWHLVSEDTVEELLLNVLNEKAEILGQVLDGKAVGEESVFKSLLDSLTKGEN